MKTKEKGARLSEYVPEPRLDYDKVVAALAEGRRLVKKGWLRNSFYDGKLDGGEEEARIVDGKYNTGTPRYVHLSVPTAPHLPKIEAVCALGGLQCGIVKLGLTRTPKYYVEAALLLDLADAPSPHMDYKFLREHVGETVVNFNDARKTTKEDVLALYDRALKVARKIAADRKRASSASSASRRVKTL